LGGVWVVGLWGGGVGGGGGVVGGGGGGCVNIVVIVSVLERESSVCVDKRQNSTLYPHFYYPEFLLHSSTVVRVM